MEKIGLIAGYGNLPGLFVKALKEMKLKVVAVAYGRETYDSLKGCVDDLFQVNIGQLQRLIETFKNEGVCNVVMVGGVNKTVMFSDIKPDDRAMSLLSRLENKSDDLLLRSIANELEMDGINIQGLAQYLPSIFAKEGCLTKRAPTEEEYKDIRFGKDMANGIGKLDIGQTVVVKDQVVLAVEAVEGTDEAIKRGGRLGNGQVVVVKLSKPYQDMRFDIPVVGVDTVRSLSEVRASVLAIEAGNTIILDKEEMIELADKEGLSIVVI